MMNCASLAQIKIIIKSIKVSNSDISHSTDFEWNLMGRFFYAGCVTPSNMA